MKIYEWIITIHVYNLLNFWYTCKMQISSWNVFRSLLFEFSLSYILVLELKLFGLQRRIVYKLTPYFLEELSLLSSVLVTWLHPASTDVRKGPCFRQNEDFLALLGQRSVLSWLGIQELLFLRQKVSVAANKCSYPSWAAPGIPLTRLLASAQIQRPRRTSVPCF
jgi:hypothetical protein